MKEHRIYTEMGNPTSMVAKHLIEMQHKCNFEACIQLITKKGMKLDALEQMEINKRSNGNIPLLDDFLHEKHSPLLSINFTKIHPSYIFLLTTSFPFSHLQ
jgi:hypothetical protein